MQFLEPPAQRQDGAGSELARRVAFLGLIALALFAVLFFRAWFLQVLSGDEYLAEADDNRTREVRVAAPRGEIRDSTGEVLVGNRPSLVLKLDPRRLAAGSARRRMQVSRIARLTEMPARRVRRTIRRQLVELPGSMVTLMRDVDHELVYFVAENQGRFPSLQVERTFVRTYSDLASSAAHILGGVGEVTEEELEDPRFRGMQPGDVVGKGGLEASYDEYLRGRPGVSRLQVDAMGRVKGELSSTPPAPGGNLLVSLDPEIQAAGGAALSDRGLPGGFLAMDVESGEVLGMGSSPGFDPAIFTEPIPQRTYSALTSEENGAPLLNRVTQGLYPTGSTFKPITALAALSGGLIDPGTVIQDTGSITVGDQEFSNARDAVFGPIDLRSALRVSSDVYFYLLGQRMNGTLRLQRWARSLGFGEPTGIDVPGEAAGLVPTPSWRNRLAAESDLVDPWTVGHDIQLAIGQADQQATPLQLAVAYAAIANGGRVLTPHLGLSVEDAAGRVVREFQPPARRRVEVGPRHAEAILEGLHQAAQSPGGTSYPVFGGFSVPVAGKTGTAERPPHADQAWYVALAPYPDPEIVVAVTFEEGGFGAETAAPAVHRILSEHYDAETEPVQLEGGTLE